MAAIKLGLTSIFDRSVWRSNKSRTERTLMMIQKEQDRFYSEYNNVTAAFENIKAFLQSALPEKRIEYLKTYRSVLKTNPKNVNALLDYFVTGKASRSETQKLICDFSENLTHDERHDVVGKACLEIGLALVQLDQLVDFEQIDGKMPVQEEYGTFLQRIEEADPQFKNHLQFESENELDLTCSDSYSNLFASTSVTVIRNTKRDAVLYLSEGLQRIGEHLSQDESLIWKYYLAKAYKLLVTKSYQTGFEIHQHNKWRVKAVQLFYEVILGSDSGLQDLRKILETNKAKSYAYIGQMVSTTEDSSCYQSSIPDNDSEILKNPGLAFDIAMKISPNDYTVLVRYASFLLLPRPDANKQLDKAIDYLSRAIQGYEGHWFAHELRMTAYKRKYQCEAENKCITLLKKAEKDGEFCFLASPTISGILDYGRVLHWLAVHFNGKRDGGIQNDAMQKDKYIRDDEIDKDTTQKEIDIRDNDIDKDTTQKEIDIKDIEIDKGTTQKEIDFRDDDIAKDKTQKEVDIGNDEIDKGTTQKEIYIRSNEIDKVTTQKEIYIRDEEIHKDTTQKEIDIRDDGINKNTTQKEIDIRDVVINKNTAQKEIDIRDEEVDKDTTQKEIYIRNNDIDKDTTQKEIDTKDIEIDKGTTQKEIDIRDDEIDKDTTQKEIDIGDNEIDKDTTQKEIDIRDNEIDKVTMQKEIDIRDDEIDKDTTQKEIYIRDEEIDKDTTQKEIGIRDYEIDKNTTQKEIDIRDDEINKSTMQKEIDIRVDEIDKNTTQKEIYITDDEIVKDTTQKETDVRDDEIDKDTTQKEIDISDNENDTATMQKKIDIRDHEIDIDTTQKEIVIRENEVNKDTTQMAIDIRVEEIDRDTLQKAIDILSSADAKFGHHNSSWVYKERANCHFIMKEIDEALHYIELAFYVSKVAKISVVFIQFCNYFIETIEGKKIEESACAFALRRLKNAVATLSQSYRQQFEILKSSVNNQVMDSIETGLSQVHENQCNALLVKYQDEQNSVKRFINDLLYKYSTKRFLDSMTQKVKDKFSEDQKMQELIDNKQNLVMNALICKVLGTVSEKIDGLSNNLRQNISTWTSTLDVEETFVAPETVIPSPQKHHRPYNQAGKRYDFFVIHADEDNDWVVCCLLQQLEYGQYGFTGCVPERDFETEIKMFENISNKINESSKILIVISRNTPEAFFKYLEKLHIRKCLGVTANRDTYVLNVGLEERPKQLLTFPFITCGPLPLDLNEVRKVIALPPPTNCQERPFVCIQPTPWVEEDQPISILNVKCSVDEDRKITTSNILRFGIPQIPIYQTVSQVESAETIFKYGIPMSDALLLHEGHTVYFDPQKRLAKWVAYILSKEDLEGPGDRKACNYIADPGMSSDWQATRSAFTDNITRGHMRPSADSKASKMAMYDCFKYTNISPEYKGNKMWLALEVYIREKVVKDFQEVRVFVIPAFLSNRKSVPYETTGATKVAIPTHMFKLIIATTESQAEPLVTGSFMIPNDQDYGRNEIEKGDGRLNDLAGDVRTDIKTIVNKTGIQFDKMLGRHSYTEDLLEKCSFITAKDFKKYEEKHIEESIAGKKKKKRVKESAEKQRKN